MNLVHGECFISVDSDIIVVKVVGAFNREGIIKSVDELKSVIESFRQKKFKILFDYLEAEGATPGAFDEINTCNLWLNTQNMAAKALVINSPANITILEKRTPARKSQNAKNFDNRSSAINWLKSQS